MSDIILNQISTACLSQFSYYLESNKEALVIDPVNEIDAYLESLNKNSASLKYILSTGTKADYINGCFLLANKTGATLVFPSKTIFRYNNILVSYDELKKCNIENQSKIENENENEKSNHERIHDENHNENENNNQNENEIHNHIESQNEKSNELSLIDLLSILNVKVLFLEDQNSIPLGKISVLLIETPGFSIDSCCYLVVDGFKKQNCLFSGNTLMSGDIGRPNEYIINLRGDKIFKSELSEMLYNSIKKLKELISENLVIYSTSAYGSFVGKSIINNKSTTLKDEKVNNKYLKDMSSEDFMRMISEDEYEYPKYFKSIIQKNLEYLSKNQYETCLEESNKPITVEHLMEMMNKKDNFLIIDTRFPFNEVKEFIPGSILISLKSLFTVWSGALINNLNSIILICKEGNELNVIKRLLRLGIFNIMGFLEGGFESYSASYEEFCKKNNLQVEDYKPKTFKFISENKTVNYVFNQEYQILDVREKIEQVKNPIANSINIPLTSINDEYKNLSKTQTLYIGCKTGIRSAIAYSILANNGFNNIYVLEGGFSKISEKGVKI